MSFARSPTIRLDGLSDLEASQRLAREGGNDLPASTRMPAWRIVLEVVREPMFAFLLAAGLIYAVLGSPEDAAVLFGFATLSASIAIVQRTRSERALASLAELASPRALVVRDGVRKRIPGREVVPGDLLVLLEGDRVPADGFMVSGMNLLIDESLLTGESQPVAKQAADQGAGPDSSADAACKVFSGTLAVRGSALALATGTGEHSEIGRIGRAMLRTRAETPRLQQQTRRLLLGFAGVAAGLSLTAVAIYGFLHGHWLEATLGGIALGMSLMPEEIPLVLSVFNVMGARRLSRCNVLVRRPAVIEALGAATVLCVDKTGTLTRNQMTLVRVINGSTEWRNDGDLAALTHNGSLRQTLETGLLASDETASDPMDGALRDAAQRTGIARRPEARLLREIPLAPGRPVVIRVWSLASSCLLAAKGAPETVAGMCGLDDAEHRALLARVGALARAGVRVLGTARIELAQRSPPEDVWSIPWQFTGLVGFADALRDSVPAAVRDCHSAGVRIMMITGDHPETARAIAADAGLPDGEPLHGREIATMDDAQLRERLRNVAVCARATPEQKLRIVNALKAGGDVVAMTGDGVNDAPALKAAHIGIAMGGRGTDVAREAASLVLLDDDFGSIVHAIRLGRRIFDNLRKALVYILAIHVPIAGMALLPIALGMPILLTPALIAMLEMVVDPACSVVLEAEGDEGDVMRRPPRSPRSTLLPFDLVANGLLQGGIALLVCAMLFGFALRSGLSDGELRSFTLLALISVNVALILANRTFASSLAAALTRPNRPLRWGLPALAVLLTSMLSFEPIRTYFRFGSLRPAHAAVCLASALAMLVLIEALKSLRWLRTSHR